MDTHGTVSGSLNSYFCSDCTATESSSDDSSDGNFYCINGGSVIGTVGACACIFCDTGFGGTNCASCAIGYSGTPPYDCSPDPCQGTSTSTDDGSDGNFYCINGGNVGGTTGSCTCTSCNTGFSGPNCAESIFLSGSNTGKCAVDGNCFSSLDYGNYESCTFTIIGGGMLNVVSFNTENNYDKLTVGGTQYDGTTGPQGVVVSAGEEISWSSDVSSTRSGFEICFEGEPCVASNSPSDDGSDGNIYCIGRGAAGGLWGEDFSSCTCLCPTGSEGPSCTTCLVGYSGDDCSPDPCQGTSTSTDDGSDGNFYCINGGIIGGTLGSCTCTVCNTGFEGNNCQSAQVSVDNMDELFNKVSNGGTINNGNSIMTHGDTVVLEAGDYKCTGTCSTESIMLHTSSLHGGVRCAEEDASCVIDGEESRKLIYVDGTGSGTTLTLRAITFKDGKNTIYNSAGGLHLSGSGTVDIMLCVFTGCTSTYIHSATTAGAVYVTTITVNFYGTSFTGNTNTYSSGMNDIYTTGNTVTIHDMCPTPYSSLTAIQGE